MLEDDLTTVAARIAPAARPDLAEAVLARLDEPPPRRWRRAVVAGGAALLVSLGLSPHVRAVAADLLGVAGIEVGHDEPDASPTPAQPLPSTRESDLDRAAESATFALSVPAMLEEPDRVTVSDQGRVVSMTWQDDSVALDQFEGAFGPVFSKQVGGLEPVEVDLGDLTGWWIPGPHDLVYVDGSGAIRSATARLAGRTLVWDGHGDVTFRLEGTDLTRRDAIAMARSVTGTS